ncbi:M1 family aminopeptidase, partial [Candidatus Neomarinimicrobiota bacterium]
GFTVIEVPSGYGSQTDFTCILQESEAFKGELHFLYHEVSHLWNPPSLDQNPSRFQSEGLACFLEYLLAERLDGKAGSLENGLALYREQFRAQCQRNPKFKDVPIAEYGAQDCTEASYTKGPLAFWLLYRLIGEQSFIDTYRRFYQEYGGKGATLEDFITTVKKVAGKDLQKFFDEWIYGTQSSDYLLGDMSLKQILELYVVEQGAPADAERPRR